jgi:hypothetical protein
MSAGGEGGSQPTDDYTFFYRNGNVNHHLAMSFFTYKGNTSAVKRVEFTSNAIYKTKRTLR